MLRLSHSEGVPAVKVNALPRVEREIRNTTRVKGVNIAKIKTDKERTKREEGATTTTRGKGTWAKGLVARRSNHDEVNFKFPLNKLFHIGISTEFSSVLVQLVAMLVRTIFGTA